MSVLGLRFAAVVGLALWLIWTAPIQAEDPGVGKFLVASRSLLDPNFSETVVLLVEYNTEGALGVIINRPTPVGIGEMVPDVDPAEGNEVTVGVGGPVAHWQMVLLYRSEVELDESQPVLDDVYFSASRSVLDSLMIDDREFRIYAGYAGWAPGQLDFEIDRGSWHVLPGDTESIFEVAPGELWRELISRGEAKWVSLGLGAP